MVDLFMSIYVILNYAIEVKFLNVYKKLVDMFFIAFCTILSKDVIHIVKNIRSYV